MNGLRSRTGPDAGLSMIMGYEFILNMQMGVWHRGVCGRWCETHTHTRTLDRSGFIRWRNALLEISHTAKLNNIASGCHFDFSLDICLYV